MHCTDDFEAVALGCSLSLGRRQQTQFRHTTAFAACCVSTHERRHPCKSRESTIHPSLDRPLMTATIQGADKLKGLQESLQRIVLHCKCAALSCIVCKKTMSIDANGTWFSLSRHKVKRHLKVMDIALPSIHRRSDGFWKRHRIEAVQRFLSETSAAWSRSLIMYYMHCSARDARCVTRFLSTV